jgi:hypothetical protein
MFKIVLEDGKELEVDNSFGVKIEWAIRDIRNLDTRSGESSKRLFLTGTDYNNVELSSIFNINIHGGFDRKKKISAKLLKDNIVIIDGYFQLISIDNFDGVKTYEVVIFDRVIKFFLDLEEKLIIENDNPTDDLDFSQWDHILTISELQKTWDFKDLPYVYTAFSTDTNQIRLNISEFSPSFYFRDIFDEIFNKWGVKWESDFLESDYFKSIVMPWNGANTLKYDPNFDDQFIWSVADNCFHYIGGRVNLSNLDATSYWDVEGLNANVGGIYSSLINNYTWVGGGWLGGPVRPGPQYTVGGTTRISYPFNEVVTGTLAGNIAGSCRFTTFPPSSSFNIIPQPIVPLTRAVIERVLSPFTGAADIEFTLKVRLDIKNNNTITAYPKIPDLDNIVISLSTGLVTNLPFIDEPPVIIRVHLVKDYDITNTFYSHDDMIKGSVATIDFTPDNWKSVSASTTLTENYTLSGQFRNVPVLSGGYFYIAVELLGGTAYYDRPGSNTGSGYFGGGQRLGFSVYQNDPTTVGVLTRMVLGGVGSDLKVYWSRNILSEGNVVRINDFLPRELSQKDFIKGVMNMFNLQLMPIPEKPDTFLIEPRDDFYKKGDIIDLRNY